MSVLSSKNCKNASRQRIDQLIGEVMSGEITKDTLINSSFDFSEKAQAMYFSNTRKNLQSDMAYMVINENQDIDSAKNFRKIIGK